MFDRDLSIYLDTEFVVRKYEEIAKVAPAMSITKSEDATVDVGFLGTKAGASVRETRSYTVSSWSMLERIWPELEKYPEFDGTYSLKPRWFSGVLQMGCSEQNTTSIKTAFSSEGRKTEGKTEKIGDHWYFILSLDEKDHLPLFTKQQYFTSGYDQLLANIHGPSTFVQIPVRVLAKVLFNHQVAEITVATPGIIYATEGRAEAQPAQVRQGVRSQPRFDFL